MRFLGVLLLCVAVQVRAQFVPTDRIQPPPPAQEFRGAWVATVNNIDWPSKPGLTAAQQQQELRAIIERAAALKLNALIFQVRPMCDALYESKLEPWSEFLTGKMGQSPGWDPLAWAIAECHQRGLELHAWFNPYRARFKSAKGEAHATHITQTQPRLVRSYTGYQWLDPGEPAGAAHSLAVMLDVVRRYDIDGLHMDDYFYPYKEKDAKGQWLDFPDEKSWKAHGGGLSRGDWRRDNINRFEHQLYAETKKIKPWVKVGISPFGIWRPSHPASVKGLDAFDTLYADARLWLNRGWMDYCAPQLYWAIDAPAQSFPQLLHWWAGENTQKRHLWPGQNSAKVNPWKAEEIVQQIGLARKEPGVTGHVHWNVSALTKDRGGLATLLAQQTYRETALVPASPWLAQKPMAKPAVSFTKTNAGVAANWRVLNPEQTGRWLLQLRVGERWETLVLPADKTSHSLRNSAGAAADAFALRAVDRAGNLGAPAVFTPSAAAP